MKLHGKGKISFVQSIHIYLRISRNLEDEIFPKGVGVVTLQNFYLVFSKNFVVFEKRPFKIFQKTFLLKTSFSLARFLFWLQTLVFDLLKPLLCWFSLKIILEFNLFLLKRNSLKFGIFISWKPPMTWHFCPCGKTPPKPPLPLVINLNSLSQLIQTGFGFLF